MRYTVLTVVVLATLILYLGMVIDDGTTLAAVPSSTLNDLARHWEQH